MSDPDRPAVLTTVSTEVLASVIAAKLQSEGIPAEVSGALTSGFRTEVPGGVQVLVRPEDLERAREVLADTGQRDADA